MAFPPAHSGSTWGQPPGPQRHPGGGAGPYGGGSDMVRICGLWEEVTRDGRPKISGRVTPTSRYILLHNAHKQNPSDPDWTLFLAAVRRDPNGQGSGASGEGSGPEAT